MTAVPWVAPISAQTEDGRSSANTTSAANGTYQVQPTAPTLPMKVLVMATLAGAGQPTVSNSKWQVATTAGAVQMERLALPNRQAAQQMPRSAGAAVAPDRSVSVQGLPPNVVQVAARVYDPVANRDAFPGEFTERRSIPIQSAGFMWIEAQDSAGAPVRQFAQPVAVRFQLPPAQWATLQDIRSGTDRIDVLTYRYNEQTQQWEELPTNGWLEDASGRVLPGEAERLIRNGTFAGSVYAAFTATQFSYLNVDYPYIGPRTLSRMRPEFRNTKELVDAMELARRIALSEKGRAAYGKVNLENADLGAELADNRGPELKTHRPPDRLSYEMELYTGDEKNGREDEISLNERLWDCTLRIPQPAQATSKAVTLVMAATILHETAHWKDDVKKLPSSAPDVALDDGPGDTLDEEGTQLDRDLFERYFGDPGWRPSLNLDDCTVRETGWDAPPMSSERIDALLDHGNWRRHRHAGRLGAPSQWCLLSGLSGCSPHREIPEAATRDGWPCKRLPRRSK